MRRVHAYILAADPNFLAASLRSYYPFVDKVIVSYDANSTSWTGTPIPVGACLDIVRSIDEDSKCTLLPGDFADLSRHPLENDTSQRQISLDAASEGADWVVQLDTDEVMQSPEVFFRCLENADRAGASALEFPSRWLYAKVGTGRYLEASSRFGRPAASYPGPLAIRAGATLRLARQADVPLYRVDLRPWNTDRHHPSEAVVHEVISQRSAILHYSWVRDPETMRRKFDWSGHSSAYSDPAVYRRWVARSARPRFTALTTPLRNQGWYRVSQLPDYPTGA